MALSDEKVDNLIQVKGFDLETLNRYEVAIFLLLNTTNTLRLEFDEYMKSFGVRGKTSELSFKIKGAIEAYFKHMNDILPKDQETNFLIDYEHFDNYFRELTGLQKGLPEKVKKKKKKTVCVKKNK